MQVRYVVYTTGNVLFMYIFSRVIQDHAFLLMDSKVGPLGDA